MNAEENTQELRVSGRTDVVALASAVVRYIDEATIPLLKAIGAPAVNQMVKALAIAQGMMAQRGRDVSWYLGFDKTKIDGEERTVMTAKPK